MKNVLFYPYVGTNYEKGIQGKRILILGESHYCKKSEDCQSNLTNDVINHYLEYKEGKTVFEPWMNTFTRFTNIFCGEQVNKENLLEFWNSIMFYNYVQIALSGPRISPNEQDFKASEKGFFEVLEEYKPDLIIVWGKRLFNSCPNNIENGGYYEVGKHKSLVYFIPHPASSKLSGKIWYAYIQEAIKQLNTY